MTRARLPLYAFLFLLLVGFLAPLVWALSGSFKPRGEIFGYPPELVPDPFTLDNYRRLLTEQPFGRWFLMSTVVAVVATVVSVFVCALAGYGFAKFRFAGKRLLFNVMFSSLSIPFAVILVPLFVILVKTGLGSPWFALIVPWVAPAFGIFMMQQYIVQSIPDSVLEAARIDGASEFCIFRTIVLPLLRPSLGALGVWQFLQSYNSFPCGRWCWCPTAPSTPCRWACRPCSCRSSGSTTSCSPERSSPSCPPWPSSCCCASSSSKGSPRARSRADVPSIHPGEKTCSSCPGVCCSVPPTTTSTSRTTASRTTST
ncbi:carbohydrate ABC transporter permease [Streptomyces sp. FXY-T5]|uniref:carbohydrate ABC transporter permease n=1 Tax=Streptomyces sp. FXY-T5 TaxID=3064901 RepID=UPI0027D29DA9|nr:carbohydrate ABC transporter permease [Streptomyces sp. FXY-T5]WMD04856.1 carbohydrate ABC transporter permease [Streptomyces sp. FXY-T5]